MAIQAKLLFRPDVLRPVLDNFKLPAVVDAKRPALAKWRDLIESKKIDAHKETAILPDFFEDYFHGLLGYTFPTDSPDRYTFSREHHVQVDGKFADGAIGVFSNAPKFLGVIEGKGPLDPLDRPFGGRNMSAVDQGYRYAINLKCDWVLVTNVRETRLYHKANDYGHFERFETARLADDEALLKKFIYLLGAERFVRADGSCHLPGLLSDSEKIGAQVTAEYYQQFAGIRLHAFEQLCAANPNAPKTAVLTAAQKLLDRVLFCTFAENRGLLPPKTITNAYEHRDKYNPRPIWETFRGLFRSIDKGNPALDIDEFNGGLFAPDAWLDGVGVTPSFGSSLTAPPHPGPLPRSGGEGGNLSYPLPGFAGRGQSEGSSFSAIAPLTIPDSVCKLFAKLAEYDYRDGGDGTQGRPVDVDILGHIFEQSITDLERIHDNLAGRTRDDDPTKGRRKKEGAFYTPAFITRYIVAQTLKPILEERLAELRAKHREEAPVTARKLFEGDINESLPDKLNAPQKKALTAFWQEWQDVLATIRILDPACGSGAFLIEAFNQLHREYDTVNGRLRDLGQASLFDPDQRILQQNLYGVDLNEEAIEIGRLSLWIKTAKHGQKLTSLDHTIRVGNSVVSDPAFDASKAFDWQKAFPEVAAAGGFDVVVANPPYVRAAWITSLKPHLEKYFRAYDGNADLYVYFYELALNQLKPGGRMGFVVTNKWMKADYAESLRRLFAESSWVESVVDFGHAKQIFPDAEVFPCILVARKPNTETEPTESRVCAIPRDLLRVDDLSEQITEMGFAVPRKRLSGNPWSLEPPAVDALMEKIRRVGISLREFAGTKPLYGIKTGRNEAFLIKTPTRNALVKADPKSAEIIKPYLRGQDVDRWLPQWAGEWMIFARKGIDIEAFVAVKRHLEQHRERLEPEPKDWTGEKWKGRKAGAYAWYEIQDTIDYWAEFSKPKIIYQVLQTYSCFSFDRTGVLGNDKIFIIPTESLYLLAVLNSPLLWWHNWRTFTHMIGETLSPMGYMMEALPIAIPTERIRVEAETLTTRVMDITSKNRAAKRDILDWLRIEYAIDKPTQKLANVLELDAEALIAEVKKIRGKKNPLTVAGLKNLREEHTRTIDPARILAAEALRLERQLGDLVNEAYGLTPEEVALMWKTAPPRMPYGK